MLGLAGGSGVVVGDGGGVDTEVVSGVGGRGGAGEGLRGGGGGA